MTPLEAFRAHIDCCTTCQESSFGLCRRGFELLGNLSGMREKDNQQELALGLPADIVQRPLVRMALGPGMRQTQRK